MKNFLVLGLILASTGTFANQRSIYDIMYLPNAGTAFGFTDLGFGQRTLSAKGDTDDVDMDGFGLTQAFGYSFTDQFSLTASLEYTNLDIDVEGASTRDQKGISDPTFTARFRVLDDTFTFDLLGGVLLGLGDSEVDNKGNSNNLQGGSALFVGAQFGQKAENFQWSFLGQVARNFERDLEIEDNTGEDVEVDIDPNNELLFRGDILNKLGEKSFLRSFASVEFQGILEIDEVGTYAAPATIYEIGTGYHHLCTENLLARIDLDYTMIKSDSAHYKSDNAWTLNLGATYQF